MTRPCGVISALRYIPMSPEDALGFGRRDNVFGGVPGRVPPDFRLELHRDTDEGNAVEISPGPVCHLDSIQEQGRREELS